MFFVNKRVVISYMVFYGLVINAPASVAGDYEVCLLPTLNQPDSHTILGLQEYVGHPVVTCGGLRECVDVLLSNFSNR